MYGSLTGTSKNPRTKTGCRVEPGQNFAIVGHTGAGKTTLISLLLRFYDIQRGQILLDGVDIRLLNMQELRKNFGIVLQDPFLFTGTLESSNATLTTDVEANVDATDAGLGPCTMARADEIEVSLAGGSPPPSFTGTITYSFTVPSGSTCTDQLASAGGSYAALPCSVSYSVTAARQ